MESVFDIFSSLLTGKPKKKVEFVKVLNLLDIDHQADIVSKSPAVIEYIKSPSEKVQRVAVASDPSVIKLLVSKGVNPSNEVIRIAVDGDIDLFKFVLEKGITVSDAVILCAADQTIPYTYFLVQKFGLPISDEFSRMINVYKYPDSILNIENPSDRLIRSVFVSVTNPTQVFLILDRLMQKQRLSEKIQKIVVQRFGQEGINILTTADYQLSDEIRSIPNDTLERLFNTLKLGIVPDQSLYENALMKLNSSINQILLSLFVLKAITLSKKNLLLLANIGVDVPYVTLNPNFRMFSYILSPLIALFFPTRDQFLNKVFKNEIMKSDAILSTFVSSSPYEMIEYLIANNFVLLESYQFTALVSEVSNNKSTLKLILEANYEPSTVVQLAAVSNIHQTPENYRLLVNSGIVLSPIVKQTAKQTFDQAVQAFDNDDFTLINPLRERPFGFDG